jgi:hypothetical protein
MNGNCGTKKAPGRLPVLIGDPVDLCPIGAAKSDEEVLFWAGLVPTAFDDGLMAGIPAFHLPPRLRAVLQMSRAWREEWVSRQSNKG